jgi:hypothetical protein
VAVLSTLITSEKSESFAGSMLNFKGLVGSRAAGNVIFIECMGRSLKAFCKFVSKFCLAAAGVHMICVSVS